MKLEKHEEYSRDFLCCWRIFSKTRHTQRGQDEMELKRLRLALGLGVSMSAPKPPQHPQSVIFCL
jgi:hypothetical protein